MSRDILKSWPAAQALALALACQPASPTAGQMTAEPPRSPEPARAASPAPASVAAGEPTSKREILGSRTPGKALVSGGAPLHPGCVAELETATNGDRIVQSIDWNGCSSSDRFSEEPYWEDGTFWYDQTEKGDRSGYNVHREVDERTHILHARFQSSGTYASSHYLAVRRGQAIDWSKPSKEAPGRTITTLTRLGEVIAPEDVDALVRHALSVK